MKKKFGKIGILFATLAALTVALFAGACGASVSAISIKPDGMPQTVFVQGQELDLSDGVLTVTKGGKDTEIPLTSDGVTVSGYEKDRIGEQEITVEYQKCSTKFTVTVVARITATGYERDYFVGDAFKPEVGNLRIAKDDGTFFSVPMTDEGVQIEGFDSSAAKSPLTVKVYYRANGMDYAGTFDVNIHALENATFHRPNKLNYKSHEDFDPAGGYIYFESGKLSRTVPLTEEMISGFDPSEASEENTAEKPLVQTIKVDYEGQNFEFTVRITYSNVSKIRKIAKDLSVLKWDQNTIPAVTASQGDLALEGMRLYFNLAAEDQAYLGAEEMASVVRAAAAYGYSKWEDAAKTYAKTFSVKDKELVLVAESYADAVRDAGNLHAADNQFTLMSDQLTKIAAKFADLSFPAAQTVGGYLAGVCEPAAIKEFVAKIDFMTSFYGQLQTIPKAWTSEDLAQYDQNIREAFKILVASKYKRSDIFPKLSAWRENDDLFEILYTFYYDRTDTSALNVLKDIILPGPLENLYTVLLSALKQLSDQVSDSTVFIIRYSEAADMIRTIEEAGNAIHIALFNTLTFENLVYSNGATVPVSLATLFQVLQRTQGGYFSLFDAMLGDKSSTALWDQYLTLVKKCDDANYDRTTEYANAVEALLRAFAELTPSRQFGFLATLNTKYRSGVPEYALSSGANSLFAKMITDHYKSVLPQSAAPIFEDLLIAMEAYARIPLDEKASEQFTTRIAHAEETYAKLPAADQSRFDSYAGFLYTKYTGIARDLKAQKKTDLNTWESTFAEIANAVMEVNVAYSMISQGSTDFYAALLSAYETAEKLSYELLSSAPPEIVSAFCNETYPLFKDQAWSLEFSVYYARTLYTKSLTSLGIRTQTGSQLLVEVYEEANLKPFMAEVSYVIWPYITAVMSGSSTAPSFNESHLLSAMKAFRELTPSAQSLFLTLEGQTNAYYSSLALFFRGKLTQNAYNVAAGLIQWERAYIIYANDPDGASSDGTTYLETMKTAFKSVQKAHDELNDLDLVSFNGCLKDMYEHYQGIYEKLPELPA